MPNKDTLKGPYLTEKCDHNIAINRDKILGHHFNKGSILLLHAIHSPFYWRMLTKTILFSGPYKKIRKTRKLESIHKYHFVERKNEGRKPDKNSSLRRLEFLPRNLD
jgi:hypothetical protein